MKYPSICQSSATGNIMLFFSESAGVVLDVNKGFIGTSNERDTNSLENITAEYLANTYGEVKSKAHAEFIVELAEVNNILTEGRKPSKANWFSFRYISGNLTLTLLSSKSSIAIDSSRKQITIPLPPECESVGEWPKVGSSVEWGHTGKGEIKSLSDGFAWIKLDNNDYTTVYVSSLRKPKTPRQELNDELYELCLTHCDSKFQASEIARKLMGKYNITKKPQ